MNSKIKVSIIGASGFTGRELVKILAAHEKVEINALLSRSFAGIDISELHPVLKGAFSMKLEAAHPDNIPEGTDAVFLALPHTKSMEFVPELTAKARLIVDLSADYRFSDISNYSKWYATEHKDPANAADAVYGLPEINREKIKNARIIANPGCYSTAAVLLIYPLLAEKLLDSAVFIDAKSGISGAGKKVDKELIFSKRYENLTPYNVNMHRHMGEILDFLGQTTEPGWDSLVFCPHLIPMFRGILANLYTVLKKEMKSGELYDLYRDYYSNERFINICDPGKFPETCQVLYTNNCSIGVATGPGNKNVVAISAIDNLVKGAAGQAVQNMNVSFGFEESIGLT
ncbi:MAG: N-acetyl-gamma-glutamyl-phosphate reductase [Elusimicrobiota bacterium]